MKLTILTDNEKSWFIPYGEKLKNAFEEKGHQVKFVFSKKDILRGDICFLLSCTNIVEQEYLRMNKHNIVVHASDLPRGKGFSPLQWQILEGKNKIVLTLFEAVNAVDAGPYYFKSHIKFNGTELLHELREKLANKIIEMCMNFVSDYDNMRPHTQKGDSSFYKRRTVNDDKININKSIKEQFNHFRIADNENYPLWFEYKGVKYNILIKKRQEESP